MTTIREEPEIQHWLKTGQLFYCQNCLQEGIHNRVPQKTTLVQKSVLQKIQKKTIWSKTLYKLKKMTEAQVLALEMNIK